MAWFRRRRRADLGTFEPPAPLPPTPLDQVISDGLLLARSAVRMAVKNLLIVAALRDRRDYDHAVLLLGAREEYLLLARHNVSAAQRMESDHRAEEQGDKPRRRFPGGKVVERDEQHRRGPQVLRLLANALATVADDTEALDALIEEARSEAWLEVSQALDRRLAELPSPHDASYLRDRESRIRAFVEVDLSELDIQAAERRVMAEWAENPDAQV
ncbi:hypothetical protein [Schumannella sp. 10F1B-5-1]|uniref:hypothetical protein n=1 Tax=Schumannella sp. 10F1B-5-1 TaxID=2590780 RepID=UPI00112FD21C|nr:hypothetical protein [Schumannella sp. 10F1B-5-1]TPW72959.1 hypothetical protein FJ658_06825 [Schumannella sp. 10F1B-5-1]